jgi:hypothetical protein
MKILFYTGLAAIVLFEILRVYFIMPMPGSQRMDSLDAAYFLHIHRWVFRTSFLLVIAAGISRAFQSTRKRLPVAASVMAIVVVWVFNFQMTAERMFEQPRSLSFNQRAKNKVDEDSIVIGVEHDGEAKAYPIRFLVYHHQVQDTVGGKPFMITYCSVCRTGRVYEPIVNGHQERFRLVGMDHFNAMFEDESTGSWWRQSTGEAVAGPAKGAMLPEANSSQLTIRHWFELHPNGLVMQMDETSKENYDSKGKFERGESKGKLTRTDRASWNDKSWVVGLDMGDECKAYDWNRLIEYSIINDKIGGKPIVLALAADQQSFVAFIRPTETDIFTIHDDLLSANGKTYDLSGRDLAEPSRRLTQVKAFQEFWHSWRAFHPNTQTY